jgi:hypothetical protein
MDATTLQNAPFSTVAAANSAIAHRHRSAPVLGLFEKRIEGDDALLELARLRFQQAGLGAEIYASTPEQLESLLQFRPSKESPVMAHLSRDFNLNDLRSRGRIVEFTTRFSGRIYGMVLHDHPDLVSRSDEYFRAALEMEAWLEKVPGGPLLFVEYAAGLEPSEYIRFFQSIRGLSRLSACVDVGHVGIWQARQAFAATHPGQDVCALKSQPPNLPQLMSDVDNAIRSALPTVLALIDALGALQKPVHFHLHDGHPLSTFSPFGVSDHLSFLQKVPLNFEYRGQRSAPLLYGPAGLQEIVSRAIEKIGQNHVSFTLEIHPIFERHHLDDAVPLFNHWTDKTNAEKMNHWLGVLSQNGSLVRDAVVHNSKTLRP